jgi:hypothetical protein
MIITVQNADFGGLAPLGYNPAPSGCLLWSWLGRTLPQSLTNYAGTASTTVGEVLPIVNPAWLTQFPEFDGYLQTTAAETATYTVAVISRAPFYGSNRVTTIAGNHNGVTERGMFVGTNASGFSIGSFYQNADTTWEYRALNEGHDSPRNNAWAFRVGMAAPSLMTLDNLTHGLSLTRTANLTATRGTAATAPRLLSVPTSPQGAATTRAELAFVGIWNRALTTAEKTAVYRVARGVAARRGVTGV